MRLLASIALAIILSGTILTGVPTANCAFGGPDGATLFITANDKLCRIRTKTKGLGF